MGAPSGIPPASAPQPASARVKRNPTRRACRAVRGIAMDLRKEVVSGNVYRVAHTYVDKGNPHVESDEFSKKWERPCGGLFQRLKWHKPLQEPRGPVPGGYARCGGE